jgi:hypothetical protein
VVAVALRRRSDASNINHVGSLSGATKGHPSAAAVLRVHSTNDLHQVAQTPAAHARAT